MYLTFSEVVAVDV